MSESEKACTDSITPDRVRNVPRMVRLKVAITSDRFHTRSRPRRSWTSDGVEDRRWPQPRQERRVLDRVPRPEASPPEHLVRPPRTEHDPHRQKRPREQRPPAGGELPALADPARDERGDGEGEGDGETDEAQVQDGRVERHQRVVLQQDVGPEPLAGTAPATVREGVGGSGHEAEEERRDDQGDERRPGHEWIAGLAPEPPHHGRDVAGQDEPPQQDRPGQRGPHPRDRVEQRCRPTVVGGHEGEREVVRDQRPLHGHRGDERRRAGRARRTRARVRVSSGRSRASPYAITATPMIDAARLSRTPLCPRAAFTVWSRWVP